MTRSDHTNEERARLEGSKQPSCEHCEHWHIHKDTHAPSEGCMCTCHSVKELDWAAAAHRIVQDEVASEMWYESRMNEQRLQKLLSNMENQIVLLITAKEDALKQRIEALIRTPEVRNDRCTACLADKHDCFCNAHNGGLCEALGVFTPKN